MRYHHGGQQYDYWIGMYSVLRKGLINSERLDGIVSQQLPSAGATNIIADFSVAGVLMPGKPIGK
jgi:hypothetical protein